MTEDDIAQIVAEHPRARAVFLKGYEAGLIQGRLDAQLDHEQWADMLVRRQRALEYLDTQARQVARCAADWVDVHKNRSAPGSAYVPMAGGAR